jgi:hypothetical protein
MMREVNRHMYKLIVFLTGVLLTTSFLMVSASGQTRNLGIKSSTTVSQEQGQEQVADFIIPVKNDSAGNIYARYGPATNSSRPIVKISASGQKLTTYDISVLPVWRHSHLRDFCIDASGTVFALVTKPDRSSWILALDLQGRLQSDMQVSGVIDPYEIAPLDDGRFLLSGRHTPPQTLVSTQTIDSQPMVSVVDPKGELDPVSVTGDIVPPPRAIIPGTKGARQDRDFEYSLAGSILTRDGDGNVYLARRGKSGIVFIFGPNGAMARRLQITVPTGFALNDIKASRQQIAALLLQNSDDGKNQTTASLIIVADGDKGTPIATYRPESTIPLVLANYDGGSTFTFIGSQDGAVTLYEAAAK